MAVLTGFCVFYFVIILLLVWLLALTSSLGGWGVFYHFR
nr:D-Ala-teichoic acid biosynthesis protein [Moritella viscosa]SHO03120.1 D-Ala-teichoic acid biosynthesis protein [Moritella viscosa]